MYPDGICKVTANTFSKCIEFADISYQLAQADTKTAIFENLCDLYNYLDASIHVQFSFVNRKTDPKQYAKSFEIKAQGDDFDDIRAEYSGILQDQLVRGNNGLTKRKFLTFTIEADNLKMARARLTRIETDLLGYFKTMGAVAHVLDAKERLEVLHGVLHLDAEPFQFEWKWLAPSGLSTKDFIASSSFRFGNSRMFGLGGKYGAVSFLNILSPELSDEMLADFLNTENGIVVNLHVQAIDQSEAIKTVKLKITDLDAMKIQEQKRAVRSGYDMDILPSDLATYGQDAKELLKTLQSRNERMFQITFLVMNTADTRQKLENDVFWAAGVAQKYNCSLVRLDYQQEQGLMSSLPLGANHIKIERSLTTSSVAVFVPFVTQELFMGGDAMYYGVNAKTGNMIMLDRKRARCPNGLKLGTPGSGKSMSCKSEIVSVFLCTPDDVYICDPEAEYYPLVKRLHGQVVKLSPTSKSYGFHHQSEDGKYLIMGNGTDAFAIPAQQESPIKAAEMTTEQNYNMIDGVLNNAPTMSELEAKAKAGEQISLFDVAEAAKAEAQKPKQTQRPAQKQKKPSIRAQLKAAKEEQQKKSPQREKTQELEV